MKGILSKVFIFATGAALGSVVTWKILDGKYQQLIQEEKESIKEELAKLYNVEKPTEEESEDDEEEPKEEKPVDPVKEAYNEVIQRNNYANPKEKEEVDVDEPYEISYEDFGEREGYDALTLTYYADGVLTDDADNPIEDVESMVGRDPSEYFDEKDNDPNAEDRDTIFVRNDEQECDYEILRDRRSFASVVGWDPHQADD